MRSPDASAADLAATQHGLLTYHQALQAGLSPAAVRTRADTGRWARVGRGVYRIGGAPLTWQQRVMAAHLGAPADNVSSHLTAGALAGLDLSPPPLPHLTVERGRSLRWPGAVIHSARLPPAEVTVFQGVPATTVARTLIDCAALLGPNRLQKLVDEALHKRLVDPAQISAGWDLARRAPGRAGEVRLRSALEPWTGPIRPGSPAEVRLRRQVVAWGLPEPELQIPVHDRRGRVLGLVDVGWSPVQIGIEYDSEEFHGPTRWRHDEERHQAIERQGWVLLRADKLDLQPGASRLRDAVVTEWRKRRAA
jgi:hypothetical protein